MVSVSCSDYQRQDALAALFGEHHDDRDVMRYRTAAQIRFRSATTRTRDAF